MQASEKLPAEQEPSGDPSGAKESALFDQLLAQQRRTTYSKKKTIVGRKFSVLN